MIAREEREQHRDYMEATAARAGAFVAASAASPQSRKRPRIRTDGFSSPPSHALYNRRDSSGEDDDDEEEYGAIPTYFNNNTYGATFPYSTLY